MKTSTVALTCTECKKEFARKEDADQHFHAINTVSENPPSYLLVLPPNCQVGTEDAARVFAQSTAEIKAKHPDKKVALLPFSYYHTGQQGSLQLLDSILAIIE